MDNNTLFITLFLCCLTVCEARNVLQEICTDPPVSANFTFDAFEGRWYEIGKIQTPGGASWQSSCVCNTIDMDHFDRVNGDTSVYYTCRDEVPEGPEINFLGNLRDMQEPGKWTQKVFEVANGVNWQVLILGDGFGATYDCGTIFGQTDYCIHFISRKPELDEETIQSMVEYSEELNLNPWELPYTHIPHDDCW